MEFVAFKWQHFCSLDTCLSNIQCQWLDDKPFQYVLRRKLKFKHIKSLKRNLLSKGLGYRKTFDLDSSDSGGLSIKSR